MFTEMKKLMVVGVTTAQAIQTVSSPSVLMDCFQATPLYENVVGQDAWCMTTCNDATADCPETHCQPCDDQTICEGGLAVSSPTETHTCEIVDGDLTLNNFEGVFDTATILPNLKEIRGDVDIIAPNLNRSLLSEFIMGGDVPVTIDGKVSFILNEPLTNIDMSGVEEILGGVELRYQYNLQNVDFSNVKFIGDNGSGRSVFLKGLYPAEPPLDINFHNLQTISGGFVEGLRNTPDGSSGIRSFDLSSLEAVNTAGYEPSVGKFEILNRIYACDANSSNIPSEEDLRGEPSGKHEYLNCCSWPLCDWS